jgi:hypothetical protein
MDGDRCSSSTVDRQRNEMKSITNNSTWAQVQSNWDEWQILEWKFKLPAGFQPTANFCHIHQLKAQDGPNNGSPVITITPRASSSGANKRVQIIHSVDGASTGKGTIVDNVPLSDFEDEWVQVREEAHYTHDGYYSIKITRMSDGKVLMDFRDDHIDMWRIGSSYIRNKFGIYRSLAGGRLNQVPVGQSPLLKNESIWMRDFRVYEKNPNPNPGLPHEMVAFSAYHSDNALGRNALQHSQTTLRAAARGARARLPSLDSSRSPCAASWFHAGRGHEWIRGKYAGGGSPERGC